MFEIGAARVEVAPGITRVSGALVDVSDKAMFCTRLRLSGLLTTVAIARSRLNADTTSFTVSLYDDVDALIWRGTSQVDQVQIDRAPVLPNGVSKIPLIGFYWLSIECSSLSAAGYTVDVELTTCPALD